MALALESDSELVHKRNVSSAVWNYFGFSPDRDGKPENEEVAICRLCRKNVSSKARNTSNLFSHLRSHHPKEYSMCKEVKAPTKRSATNTSAIQPTISYKAHHLRALSPGSSDHLDEGSGIPTLHSTLHHSALAAA